MEEKEKKIYNSAIKLFGKYGPKKVSIDSIIEDAEVGKGTFYKYFSSKENLYKKIVDEIFFRKYHKKEEKKFCSENIENYLLLHYIGYLTLVEYDIFLKNFFLENKDFYFGEVNSEYINKIKRKVIFKSINFLGKNKKEKEAFIDSLDIFIRICLLKKESLSDKSYDDFCLRYANIFTFGYLQNKNFLNLKLDKFRKNILL